MSLKNISNTRYFVAGLLFAALGGCSVSTTDAETTATTIKVGGSAEGYDMIELLAEAYSETGAAEFEFDSPSQTGGGIEGVKADIIDIGTVSRKIDPAELDDGMTYISMVEAPLMVVVHDSVTGVTDITAEQIKAVYSGEITNWQELGGPDEPIVLFDLSEDENEKVVLREAYLGADLEISPDAVVFTEDDELVETLAVTEFSIAAVPSEDELDELPLIPLSIDGIEPTSENIQSGEYTMLLALGVVVPETLDADVQAFIDFAISAEGKQILSDAEYIVAADTTAD